jgi:hypothetical protein
MRRSWQQLGLLRSLLYCCEWRKIYRTRTCQVTLYNFTLVSALSYELADIQHMIDLNANVLAQGFPLGHAYEQIAAIQKKLWRQIQAEE